MQGPIDVGARKQLLFDDFWFASRQDITLSMHPPRVGEEVLHIYRPCEEETPGNYDLSYPCVIVDEGRYRMWYRADEQARPETGRPETFWSCYAESADGVHWDKPDLGIISRDGSRHNNIVLPLEGEQLQVSNLCVARDDDAPADERYKGIARARLPHVGSTLVPGVTYDAIFGYVSPDGLRWRPAEGNPLLTDSPFDSHNTLVMDNERGLYVVYTRGLDRSVVGPYMRWDRNPWGLPFGGRRMVRRSESPDFRTWSPLQPALRADADDPLNFHIYTNAAVKYPYAARSYFMFPMILYGDDSDRKARPDQVSAGISDVQFASSRDGVQWDRRFRQPFISAGLDPRDWGDRNPVAGVGVVQTGPTEMSVYYQRWTYRRETALWRGVLRLDGLVSVDGPYAGGGEFTTHPIVFEGRHLELNYTTSAGGSVFVELQDRSGVPLPGYGMDEAQELFGDTVAGRVRWNSGEDLGELAGQVVRLRIRMRDAQLYAFQFCT
jgi:hypothetical protein